MAYHQLPTQIINKIRAVNFDAHDCLVKIPKAAIISAAPLTRIHKDSFPKTGGINASNTPGFTRCTVPLKRKMNTSIFEPIGKSLKLIFNANPHIPSKKVGPVRLQLTTLR